MAVVRAPALSSALSPFKSLGRRLALTLSRRGTGRGEDPAVMAKFRLFCVLFGFFSVFHVFNALFAYQQGLSWDLALVLITALGALFVPGRPAVFLLLIAASLVSGWVQAPVQSNHTMMRNLVALGFAVLYGVHLLRGSRFSEVFTDFSALGGGLLLVMYVFGIFHKLNEGFLDPVVSCAVMLWSMMPAPLNQIEGPWMDQAAIWGTFAVEGLIVAGLLTRRYRHVAIVVGIGFHLLLALSDFRMYLSFTMLSIALHSLFLTAPAAERVLATRLSRETLALGNRPARMAVMLGLLFIVIALAAAQEFSRATMAASLLFLPLCGAIALAGAERPGERGALSVPGRAVSAVVVGGFFLLCLSPYTGLRTAQSINMFANLRVEGGVSNHLVFREPLGWWPYAGDVVRIEEGSPAHVFDIDNPDRRDAVYYELLVFLERYPGVSVTFVRDGLRYRDQTAATLARDIEAVLHPPWMRKFINFRPVSREEPPLCS